MKTEQSTAKDNKEDPFRLPRIIGKSLKRCSEAFYEQDLTEQECVKYLWIYVGSPAAGNTRHATADALELDEWLNVIDEAASLGAHCVLVSAQTPLESCAYLWHLCQWAQDTHDMMVGLYAHGAQLTEQDIEAMEQLNLTKMCLFVDQEHLDEAEAAVQKRVTVCPADVEPQEHRIPCELPEDIICVSADGTLYTCGLVLGDPRFSLGNVFDRPLFTIVDDDSLPRTVPVDVPHNNRRDCSGCPPLMLRRVKKNRESHTEPTE